MEFTKLTRVFTYGSMIFYIHILWSPDLFFVMIDFEFWVCMTSFANIYLIDIFGDMFHPLMIYFFRVIFDWLHRIFSAFTQCYKKYNHAALQHASDLPLTISHPAFVAFFNIGAWRHTPLISLQQRNHFVTTIIRFIFANIFWSCCCCIKSLKLFDVCNEIRR